MLVDRKTTQQQYTKHFTQFLHSLAETLHPATPAERTLIRQIAFAWWRCSRVQGLQRAMLITVERVPFVLAFDRRALRVSEHWLNLHDELRELQRQRKNK